MLFWRQFGSFTFCKKKAFDIGLVDTADTAARYCTLQLANRGDGEGDKDLLYDYKRLAHIYSEQAITNN